MQGFIKLEAFSAEDIREMEAAREAGAPFDLAAHADPMLLAVSRVASVVPSKLGGAVAIHFKGGKAGLVLGTVEDIAAKIAVAQPAPERAPVLPPRLRFEGPGGVSIVRVSDIAGIVSVPPGSSGTCRCFVHTTWGSVIGSYEPAEVLEARIDAQVRL